MKIVVIFVLMFQLLFSQDIFTLSSASRDGNYYKLALRVKKIIEQNSKYKIKVVTSKGSIDNINRLKSKFVDLAIIQSDTALYAESGLPPFVEPIYNIKSVIMFYDEPFYIVTNLPNVHRLEQLSNLYVNVGQSRSGLLATAKVILNSADMWNKITPFYLDNTKAINYLLEDKIEAIFINELSPFIKKRRLQRVNGILFQYLSI